MRTIQYHVMVICEEAALRRFVWWSMVIVEMEICFQRMTYRLLAMDRLRVSVLQNRKRQAARREGRTAYSTEHREEYLFLSKRFAILTCMAWWLLVHWCERLLLTLYFLDSLLYQEGRPRYTNFSLKYGRAVQFGFLAKLLYQPSSYSNIDDLLLQHHKILYQ